MAIPQESRKGFYLVIGLAAGLYVAAIIIRRLPQ
jgi:hypothetical protein